MRWCVTRITAPQANKIPSKAIMPAKNGKANRASEILFGGEIGRLNDKQLVEIFADVPSCEANRQSLAGEGWWIVEALRESGLSASSGEARRAITDGGVYVNNRRVTDVNRKLTADDLASETVMVLRKGKRNYALLRFA